MDVVDFIIHTSYVVKYTSCLYDVLKVIKQLLKCIPLKITLRFVTASESGDI